MKSSLKISFRNSSFQRQSHLLCVCSEAFQIRYLPLIFGIKSCWRVSQSVTHKHELWIRFTLSYAMMKALHLTWHSATHKRERRIWFPLIYRHLMKALLRLAAVRDTKQAGELRGDTTIYCLEFCAGFNDAKRQHLSTINTNSDLSFTTIQQQTYRRKQLMDQADDNSLTALLRSSKVPRGRKYMQRKASRKTHSTNGVNIESRVA